MNYVELRDFIDQLVKEHEQRKLLNELRLEIELLHKRVELLKQKNKQSKWTKNKDNKLC